MHLFSSVFPSMCSIYQIDTELFSVPL